ncbi:MAG: molybdate ABC transporter permease subunit [SAR202 cluster bacterium]|nr:molybdate ABC transporter permease subunit [SAR202 cluster bacterium]MDP6301396.1 molybdate ABC transporter permease subunit [SAR202 cluster bacterium]MDP7104214.1 molybdate ABC transporter permease subunit [SAR202 cluster bacterium]MDP7226097.1 molybdate ABC transporter permease subunit [SAR202 cluster bacterium]MDP7412870.1 molybdate ABC transporter permease subunit [SAR202 cluster bacterium]
MNYTAVFLTLQVAAVATAINLPIAIGVSWLVVKRRVRGRFIIEVLASLPLALPPVVSGYFLLLVLGRDGPVGVALRNTLGVDVVFTWVAAALAAAVVSFPLLVRAVMAAMEAVDERLELSARSLGAGPIRVALTITLPLAYRGILAGLLLGFVRALSEFGATIVVAGNIPGRTQTLPLAIFESVQLGEDADALTLVVVSMSLAVISLLIHNWLLQRTRNSR